MVFAIILKIVILLTMSGKIAENIATVKAKIANLRPSAELVAVSKNHDEAAVREAIAAGQRIFGENRVQEAQGKFPKLRTEFSELRLHLIGPLQTNKIKDALAIFDVIETLDREKLAREFVKHDLKGKEFFIQVNIGEEPQKAGVSPQETEAFYKLCTEELKLNITGLMCIPPVGEPAFMYFALLKNMAKKLNPGLKLSMGMSADYEQALELGADFVRIGTAVFGQRVINV